LFNCISVTNLLSYKRLWQKFALTCSCKKILIDEDIRIGNTIVNCREIMCIYFPCVVIYIRYLVYLRKWPCKPTITKKLDIERRVVMRYWHALCFNSAANSRNNLKRVSSFAKLIVPLDYRFLLIGNVVDGCSLNIDIAKLQFDRFKQKAGNLEASDVYRQRARW